MDFKYISVKEWADEGGELPIGTLLYRKLPEKEEYRCVGKIVENGGKRSYKYKQYVEQLKSSII